MDDPKNPPEGLPLDSATPASGNPEPAAPGSADTSSANPTVEPHKTPEQPETSGSSLPKKTKPSSSPGASLTKLSKPPGQGLSKLILEAVATSEKRVGLSLQALKKIVAATGYDVAKKKTHFKRVLLSLVAKGLLQKLKGTGAAGSFGIGKKMGVGARKKKAPKKRETPLKVGIVATSLAERGQLLTMDLLKQPSHQPAALGRSQPEPEG